MPSKTISSLASNSETAYRDLVWRAASGEEVTPEDAIATAVAAGYSASDLNRHVEEVEQRIQKHAEFHAADYEGRRAELKAELKAATEAQAIANEAGAKIREDWQKATDRMNAVERRERSLTFKEGKAINELSQFMRKTGIQPDDSDPKNFRLS